MGFAVRGGAPERAPLERRGHGPLRLDAGDILLLPHGDAHVVHGSGTMPPGPRRLRGSQLMQGYAGQLTPLGLDRGRVIGLMPSRI